MASTDKPADPESRSSSSTPAAVDYFKFDVILRFLLFAASVVAIVVMVTSEQTVTILFNGFPLRRPAKFRHSPAFIYFVVAFCVSGLYSLITALASFFVIKKPDLKLKFLLHFLLWDTLVLGIVASATGAAGAVAYLGLKGNDHVGWQKICTVYDKFCRHIAGSVAVALFGSVMAVWLIQLSAYSLHSRVPK